MQTKVRVSADEKRYVSFNLGEIQFKNPNGKYIFTRLEYLELKKEKILANTKEFETLFNDIIDRFNWNTDEKFDFIVSSFLLVDIFSSKT